MISFESIGVERQTEALTKAEANKQFEKSCTICCTHGIRLSCDRCAISYTHIQVVEAFNIFEKCG